MNNKQTDSNQKEEIFENDHLSVSVSRSPGCKVRMAIQVTPLASEAAYQKAIKKINKEVSLPGFRKGKAPAKMVEDNYSKYVNQEWQDIMVQAAFQDAIKLTSIYPLSRETIQKPELRDASRKNGGQIVIEFESSPEIPEIEPKKLKLKKVEKKEIKDEDLEEALKDIQLHHATWEEIDNRGVEKGDYIDVDIEDASAPGTFICKDTRFEVEEGKMGAWMLKLVIGKKTGDVVEGTSERSEDLDPDTEFTPTECKITIKSIKTPNLPEIDEELAQKIGAESVEDLKTKLTSNLNSQAEEEVRHKLRMQVENSLAKHFPFEVPESLILSETNNRLNHLRHKLKNAGETEEAISSKLNEDREKIRDDAIRAFRLFFISRHIAEENKISVSQDELVRELVVQMYSPSSPIDTSLDPEEVRSKVYVNLLSQKVKDFLIEQAAMED